MMKVEMINIVLFSKKNKLWYQMRLDELAVLYYKDEKLLSEVKASKVTEVKSLDDVKDIDDYVSLKEYVTAKMANFATKEAIGYRTQAVLTKFGSEKMFVKRVE